MTVYVPVLVCFYGCEYVLFVYPCAYGCSEPLSITDSLVDTNVLSYLIDSSPAVNEIVLVLRCMLLCVYIAAMAAVHMEERRQFFNLLPI